MENGNEQRREFGADLLRVTATFFIIGVHFYLHNGFYSEPQEGFAMWAADTARWLFFTCVPLFAVLTGYLKCKAVPSKTYYQGILPILLTWLLISGLCIAFKIGYLHQEKTAVEWLADILNYKAANYSWYIEMYFGLFLLCPIVNSIFRSEEKYQKTALVTVLLICFLPGVGNGWMVDQVRLDFVPNYITGTWPVAYYLMGGYIRMHQPKLPKRYLLILVCLLCILKGLMTYVSADGGKFSDGIGGGYDNYMVAMITAAIFLLVYQIDTKQEFLKRLAAHVSARCLIIYLISWIFDSILQPLLQPFTSPASYWWVFWVHTISVFLLSLAASEILYPLIRQTCGCCVELATKLFSEK